MNCRHTYADLLVDSGIPTRFRDCEFRNFDTPTVEHSTVLALAQRSSEAIIAKPKAGASLILCGAPGTGKTHLACAVANAVMREGRSVKFGSVLAAIRHVKDSYRRDSAYSETEAIADLLDPDLLVLDEVGVQVGSEHEKMILFEVINERYQWCSSTILVSNLNRTELSAYLGDRIMDRFSQTGAVLAFGWQSFRKRRLEAA